MDQKSVKIICGCGCGAVSTLEELYQYYHKFPTNRTSEEHKYRSTIEAELKQLPPNLPVTRLVTWRMGDPRVIRDK